MRFCTRLNPAFRNASPNRFSDNCMGHTFRKQVRICAVVIKNRFSSPSSGFSKCCISISKLHRLHLKTCTDLVQLFNLRIVEPVPYTLPIQVHGFGIDIIHTDGFCPRLVYMQDFKRQETPAACRVGQELVPVHRCMKLAKCGYSSI